MARFRADGSLIQLRLSVQFLAPVRYLCVDLLRIRRNPPIDEDTSQGRIAAAIDNVPSALEVEDGAQISANTLVEHEQPVEDINRDNTVRRILN